MPGVVCFALENMESPGKWMVIVLLPLKSKVSNECQRLPSCFECQRLVICFPPNVFRASWRMEGLDKGFVVKHTGPESHLGFSYRQSGYGVGAQCELFIRPGNASTGMSWPKFYFHNEVSLTSPGGLAAPSPMFLVYVALFYLSLSCTINS